MSVNNNESLQDIFDYWIREYPQQRDSLVAIGVLFNKLRDLHEKELKDLISKRDEIKGRIVIPTFTLLGHENDITPKKCAYCQKEKYMVKKYEISGNMIPLCIDCVHLKDDPNRILDLEAVAEIYQRRQHEIGE